MFSIGDTVSCSLRATRHGNTQVVSWNGYVIGGPYSGIGDSDAGSSVRFAVQFAHGATLSLPGTALRHNPFSPILTLGGIVKHPAQAEHHAVLQRTRLWLLDQNGLSGVSTPYIANLQCEIHELETGLSQWSRIPLPDVRESIASRSKEVARRHEIHELQSNIWADPPRVGGQEIITPGLAQKLLIDHLAAEDGLETAAPGVRVTDASPQTLQTLVAALCSWYQVKSQTLLEVLKAQTSTRKVPSTSSSAALLTANDFPHSPDGSPPAQFGGRYSRSRIVPGNQRSDDGRPTRTGGKQP